MKVHSTVFAACLAVVWVLSAVGSWAVVTEMVSVQGPKMPGNHTSMIPHSTPDGRYICFTSSADNLVPDDTNGRFDVFVFDRQTGVTNRVSTSSTGAQANGDSVLGAISNDGRYVAFASWATNVVPGVNSGFCQYYRKDTQAGMLRCVSTTSTGVPANSGPDMEGVEPPTLSSDGRYVCFSTTASNLVSNDTNGRNDVFVKDCAAGTTIRASTRTGGGQVSDGCYDPRITSDGGYVFFTSGSQELAPANTAGFSQVFVKNLHTNSTGLVSCTYSGEPANGDCGLGWPRVGALSRYEVFESAATNLTPGDTNGSPDIFLKDEITKQIVRVSVAADGGEPDGGSYSPSMTSDGRYVSFTSDAANLDSFMPDTNNSIDVFARDLYAGQTFRVSVGTGYAQKPQSTEEEETGCFGYFDGRCGIWTSNANRISPVPSGGNTQVYFSDFAAERIPIAKTRPDFEWVTVIGAVTFARETTFYVQQDGLTTPGMIGGIRCFTYYPPGWLAEGARCEVGGYIETDPETGERGITVEYVVPVTSTWRIDVRPTGMSNRSVGGGDWGYDPVTGAGHVGVTYGIGPNNIGMLVRTWGKVTSSGTDFVGVDDGAGIGVPCVLPPGTSPDPSWDVVAVTGVCGCYMDGGIRKAVIYARDADDVIVYAVKPPPAPGYIIGEREDWPVSPPQVAIHALWPALATSMTLYRGSDGIVWEPVGVPVVQEQFGSYTFGRADVIETSHAYYRMTGSNSGGEGPAGPIVHARPLEVEPGGVLLGYPHGSTGVELVPTFNWTPNWVPSATLAYYHLDMQREDWEDTWAVQTRANTPQTSLVFGQSDDVWTILAAAGPLQEYTQYRFWVAAVDTENWVFAESGDGIFTTGSGGPPPPPP